MVAVCSVLIVFFLFLYCFFFLFFHCFPVGDGECFPMCSYGLLVISSVSSVLFWFALLFVFSHVFCLLFLV